MSLRDQLQLSLGNTYTLERELGGGGMSRVFLAEEHALGRRVVVKVLPDELAGTVSTQRFKREISLAARLHHPHIVPLLTAGETQPEAGQTSGIVYYTMPFVDGETLRDRISRGPIKTNEAVRILREVATALAYAHSHHVVHRDIKPENVLLAGGVAAVTDFGVAKAVETAAASESHRSTSTLTSFGVALGTPAYMSPEQAAADPDVDHRADLYSLGCLGYEMLTGAPPFAGRSPQQVLAAHVTEQPVPVTATNPALSAPLAALIMRCLAKRPAERPGTAEEVVAALDDLTVPSGGHQPFALSARRRMTRIGAVAAAAAVVVLVLVAVSRRPSSVVSPIGRSPRSVGVLPFDNLSTDKENEYFSEGMTQEITDALAKVPGLRVAAQRPGSGGQQDSRDTRRIGRSLGVETLLHGSVQRSGNRVRISARLMNVADGIQIWSDRYDRELKDVFAVQDEITKSIVGGLRLKLGGAAPNNFVRVATADPEAHNLYLQGMYYWNRRTIATLRKSISYFEQAIAKDPSYAAPYAGLALAYAVVVDYEDVSVAAMVDSALIAGNKALALDSTSADAYTAIAQAHANLWENAKALSEFRHAIALDSNNARARHWYAEFLGHIGQLDEARKQIRRAQELEPLTLIINANVGRVELESRHYAEAEAALRHTIELDSTSQTAHSLLAAVLLQQGKFADAVTEQELALRLTGARPTSTLTALGYVYAKAGKRAEAEKILREVESRAAHESVSYGSLALLRSALGNRDAAVAALDTAVARYDAVFKMRSREASYDELRKDPRASPLFAKAEGLR